MENGNGGFLWTVRFVYIVCLKEYSIDYFFSDSMSKCSETFAFKVCDHSFWGSNLATKLFSSVLPERKR